MKILTLACSLLAVLGIMAALSMATLDSTTGSDTVTAPVETTTTVRGVLEKIDAPIGIPGTTPPSSYYISIGGTTYFLLLDGAPTHQPGTLVSITGTIKIVESEAPGGQRNSWSVIEVDTIRQARPNER